MAFAATIPETEDDGPGRHESLPQEGADAYGNESSQEDDKGLFIPSYLEEVIPDDPVLQVKMAHVMPAQEVETWRCFTCNQPGHLQRDHWKYEGKNGNGPLQLKGPPLNKLAQERVKVKPLCRAKACLKQILQSEEGPVFEPGCMLLVHRP